MTDPVYPGLSFTSLSICLYSLWLVAVIAKLKVADLNPAKDNYLNVENASNKYLR